MYIYIYIYANKKETYMDGQIPARLSFENPPNLPMLLLHLVFLSVLH